MTQILIAGCGYIGERVARIFMEKGADVTCLVRSPDRQARLSVDGLNVATCSFDDPATIPRLDSAGRTIFYFVPPPGGGITDTRARNFCRQLALSGAPAKIIYMSATSVYSEVKGGVVTESSPTDPASAMGKRRLDAETAFMQYGATSGASVVILRVSGIYGPGRLPLMQIRQGQPVLREEEAGPSNRIHADDLARICAAAAAKGRDGDIFNVSDGNASSMTSYFNACADALGEPRQPQVTMEEARKTMSPLMLSYVSESRIVDNSRMLRELGITLQYPTYCEGLAASMR
ncbi:SDR family oxidoreductase [Pelotalea chapellei]|uniref:SDR family oxidoreductase n=1 Tax=Pelotalea chapellei TaxID=44671 RepID=A0ABS5U4P6_9BACT|nr:SDR family oxidoreductase [Pelotalea chapellei]MBT1070638.1 SDR family oxidoreductase [Pelotalea chapellei]